LFQKKKVTIPGYKPTNMICFEMKPYVSILDRIAQIQKHCEMLIGHYFAVFLLWGIPQYNLFRRFDPVHS
jgi:hypothetical protein